MNSAIFDPFCGVAGNMILGALIDAGVEVPRHKKMLRLLPLAGEPVNPEPEYSDCVRLARRSSVEAMMVMSAARTSALRVLHGEATQV